MHTNDIVGDYQVGWFTEVTLLSRWLHWTGHMTYFLGIISLAGLVTAINIVIY